MPRDVYDEVASSLSFCRRAYMPPSAIFLHEGLCYNINTPNFITFTPLSLHPLPYTPRPTPVDWAKLLYL
ncbi:MAG: hypothetical protein RML10_04960 [Geminocystis sp.]|nr:hypothetical protein [Geminocystis sp.]